MFHLFYWEEYTMKISELKLGYIRTSIEVDFNGEKKEVTIFNLVDDKRKEVLDMMIDKQKSNLSEPDFINEIMTEIFFECTDLELDEDIIDVINAPSLGMLNVLNEINEIIHELQCELMLSKITEINRMEQLAYTNLMLAKTQNTTRILENIKNLENKDDESDIQ